MGCAETVNFRPCDSRRRSVRGGHCGPREARVLYAPQRLPDRWESLPMLIVMEKGVTETEISAVVQKIERMGYKANPIPGAQRVAIGITGNQTPLDPEEFESMPGVKEAIRVTKPYKLVGREMKGEDTVIVVRGREIGGNRLAVIAGPCAVENEEQALSIGELVAEAGANFFRGGAYKPRTSPYSFQGLGEPGLKILATVREKTGLPIVTEAMDPESVALVEEYADVIQIGARSLQNFSPDR